MFLPSSVCKHKPFLILNSCYVPMLTLSLRLPLSQSKTGSPNELIRRMLDYHTAFSAIYMMDFHYPVINNKLKYIENIEIYKENLPCVRFFYAHHYLVTTYCIYHSYCCDDNHPNSIPRTLGMLSINISPLLT